MLTGVFPRVVHPLGGGGSDGFRRVAQPCVFLFAGDAAATLHGVALSVVVRRCHYVLDAVLAILWATAVWFCRDRLGIRRRPGSSFYRCGGAPPEAGGGSFPQHRADRRLDGPPMPDGTS